MLDLQLEGAGGEAEGAETELRLFLVARRRPIQVATYAIRRIAAGRAPTRSPHYRKVYGQTRSYVTHLPGTTPPYLLILDVARTMMVWDRSEGGFGGFGAGRRIDLPSLHERISDISILRDIWTHPQARNPRARAQIITETIAGRLAILAASLEKWRLELTPTERRLWLAVARSV